MQDVCVKHEIVSRNFHVYLFCAFRKKLESKYLRTQIDQVLNPSAELDLKTCKMNI